MGKEGILRQTCSLKTFLSSDQARGANGLLSQCKLGYINSTGSPESMLAELILNLAFILALDSQHFLFIFNHTRPAASNDNSGTKVDFGSTFWSPWSPSCCSLSLSQHSKLHNSVSHNGFCYVNFVENPLLHNPVGFNTALTGLV